MKRLRKKLRSERGASILLALLLFLVCMMVGSSVLAAAASNAGKARSNRTEQQKFLNLTSAIQLVADEIATEYTPDEIAKAEYTGKYTVWEWEEEKTVTTRTTDNSVNPPVDSTTTTVTKESYFYCMQTEGEYSCGDLTAQLPFREKLDQIFGKQFKVADGSADKPGYKSLAATGVGQYDLLVTLENFPGDAPEGYKVPEEVIVRVKLDGNTHHILLTAWEGKDIPADPSDPTGTTPDLSKAVQAELVAREGTVLDYNPGSRKVGTLKVDGSGVKTFPDPKPEEKSGDTTTTYAIVNKVTKPYPDPAVSPPAWEPMQWELSWVRKGGAAP